ncbi:flagellar hook assembly protein FlgD [Jonesia quinghaiensis]|uniref:flagellar hook assembly protein FlgD n=1 Tax=Jonesia quinghaiensis TaxID=262806 RepID=UPI00040D94F0|nr:flagellar hook capping FlgD N-terminal domain-containing protein [Jonesia quinghaiensis]
MTTIDTSQTPVMPTTTQAGMYTTPTGVRSPKQDMDGEMFLNLLVTQLKNQDPSSPMDTTEMMAQTSQLASMEQLTKLTTISQENFALQMRVASAALVGQTVTYTGEDGKPASGVVDSISYAGEVPVVKIGDTEISLDAVAGISSSTAAQTPTTPTPQA